MIAGAFGAAVAGGSRRRRITAALIFGGGNLVVLALIEATDWLLNPGLSPIVIVVLAAGIGVGSAALFSPLENRRVLAAGLGAAAAGLVGATLFSSWIDEPSWTQIFLLTIMAFATGALVGALIGGEVDRRASISTGMVTTLGLGAVIAFDRFISAWSPGRTIGTIGPQSPNLSGTFWERMNDYAGHQILPSLSLALIGFATFMRFTRSSMLDTLKSDYVRTAKAKGLPATQVVLRHAFRTALIPVMTVITISFAVIIEGAVITERVFAWQGMGTLFIDGLTDVDPYPVMGFLVVVSVSIVLLNALADIMYAYLDPRIRV